MPDKFIVTDPDLMLNENIPSNFIEIMDALSNKYGCHKIGFAIDITDKDQFYQSSYAYADSIYEWESQFWNHKILDDQYELYNAGIDTTFSLITKVNADKHGIRIAGNFTCKHLPWYIDNNVLTIYDTYKMYINTNTNISTISSISINYIKSKYLILPKNNEIIFIEKDDKDLNISFWTEHFTNWESNKFNIFDKFLDKNKIFIDIGAWIGTTCIYGSKFSKHVYAIEADPLSYQDMVSNCKLNSKNITCINKAVYNDNKPIKIGNNKFLDNARMNDSTSQVYDDTIYNESSYIVNSIRIGDLISDYNIDPLNISLIKVDIEGSEEHILQDLFEIRERHKIPIYISFHYTWWTNKDLNRFTFLTNEQKETIITKPFCSILF